MYDFCGLPDVLCGPYVGAPGDDAKLPTEDQIYHHLVHNRRLSHEVALSNSVRLAEGNFAVIDTLEWNVKRTDLSYVVSYHEKILRYFKLFDHYEKIWDPSMKIISELHYYKSRPLSHAALHHDSKGTTHFVILHYYNDVTIYGPEYTYAMHREFDRDGEWCSNCGAQNAFSPWPPSIREQIVASRQKLTEAWGKSSMVKHVLIPPRGAIGFVDELIHHSTPFMERRLAGNELYSTVNITSETTIKTLGIGGKRPRALSLDFEQESFHRLARDATVSATPRTFMRVWVTVQRAY